jgi:hypothetical protein
MLITNKSFKNFIIINSVIFCVGITQYIILLHTRYNYILDFCLMLFIFLIRNYSILKFVDRGISNKQSINKVK